MMDENLTPTPEEKDNTQNELPEEEKSNEALKEELPSENAPSESEETNETDSVQLPDEYFIEETTAPTAQSESTEETPKSPYVYHWEADKYPASPVSTKKRSKLDSGAKSFAVIMSIAFGIAILALFLVLILIPSQPAPEMSYTVSELAEICSPYTVAIEVTQYSSEGVSMSVGTGFILTENGYIITNYHVVENAKNITVHTYDGKEYSGHNIGYDDSLDLAVIRVHPAEGEKLPTAPIADSSEVQTGDKIIAIGTPKGLEFAWSVTVGYVSHANRSLTINGKKTELIQFDAAVNPGNSGGPLINGKGEVIGIVQMRINETTQSKVYDENGNVIGYTETSTPAAGIGLAIPINKVMDTYERFKDEDMDEPMLGIVGVNVEKDVEYFSMENTFYGVSVDTLTGKKYVYIDYVLTELTDELLKQGELVTPTATGFWVSSINSSSGAKGILSEGDIITAFSGVELKFADSNGDGIEDVDPYSTVIGILSTKKAGERVEVTFERDGQSQTVEIVLTEKD